MLPTDPASVEAVIAGLLRFRHCFHRRGVGGEREAFFRFVSSWQSSPRRRGIGGGGT